MLRREGSPDNFILKYEELFAAGYNRWTDKYPLLDGPLRWVEHLLKRAPLSNGVPCPIEEENRVFRVIKTPPFTGTPGVRILYEVDEADYIVTLWHIEPSADDPVSM